VERHRSASHLQFGAVTLIPEERLLLRDGQPVSLTPQGVRSAGRLGDEPRSPTHQRTPVGCCLDRHHRGGVEPFLLRLRDSQGFGEHADGDRYIETVPKQGYRFVAPVVRVEAGGGQLPEALAPTTHTPQHQEASERWAAASEGTERRAPTLLTLQAGPVWWQWLGLGAVLTLGAVWFFGLDRPPRASTPSTLVQYLEPVTGRLAETGMFSVSPDGRHLVFAAEGADGVLRLWARTMSALEPVPLPGTEVFKIIPPVVWSPDSRFVAFDTGGVVKKVSLDGGAPQTVCE
jgi:DNA-binding winged helix-turn-helix (wHTH) protein